jgi:hypothetical protein
MNKCVKLIRSGKITEVPFDVKHIIVDRNLSAKDPKTEYTSNVVVIDTDDVKHDFYFSDGDQVAWSDGSVIIETQKDGKIQVWNDDRQLSVSCREFTECVFSGRHALIRK